MSYRAAILNLQAILLHSGSDCSSPKGLYSLKMDSPSDDGDSAFYTIVFQDQGDATNFCYLLETFFGELDDFTADVVPLTIDVRTILDASID